MLFKFDLLALLSNFQPVYWMIIDWDSLNYEKAAAYLICQSEIRFHGVD